MAYNVKCELKETHSRSKGEILSGRTVATFRAKVFRNDQQTGFVGTGQASNSINKVIQFKYFGEVVTPNKHTVVMNDKAYIIVQAMIINSHDDRLVKGKTIYRAVLA